MVATLVVVYLVIGFVFAIAFSWRGAASVDDDALAGSWGFRILILPGAMLLWPLLAVRWMHAARNRKEAGHA